MAYQPIENYGIIGDMHTVALIGMNGSIDWFCFPHFDSPSAFGALLDDKKGGHFSIAPLAEDVECKQLYWPETNVLITRFLSSEGVGEITDYMTVTDPAKGGKHRQALFRHVTSVRGTIGFRVECFPAFSYARDAHETDINPNGAAFHSSGLSLGLSASTFLEKHGRGAAQEFTLEEGQSALFMLKAIEKGSGCETCLSEKEAFEVFVSTVEYWQKWLSKCTYRADGGRWFTDPR